jgi:ribosomal-protein-serine acetyltransferase
MPVEAPSPWRPPPTLPQRFETPRVVLRFWTPEDAPAMLAALNVDRDSLFPWLPWVRTDNGTVPECIFHIERFRRAREQVEPPPTNFMMGIFDRASGEALGGTGLGSVDPSLREAEIGYWIRADRRSKGFCTEAVAGLISSAFKAQAGGGWGLRRIKILCAGANVKSQAVPRKLGLRQEVHQVKGRWVEGIGWDDTLGWGVLAEEWEPDAQATRRPPG